MVKSIEAGDQIVTVDRRRGERRDEPAGVFEVQPVRRKKQRRRQIDPTTCERDYTNDEVEFMHAFDAYKRTSGRMFPTCSEILEVIRDLGYSKQVELEATESNTSDEETADNQAEAAAI